MDAAAASGSGSTEESKTELVPPEAGPPAPVAAAANEVTAYLSYIAVNLLVKRGVWDDVRNPAGDVHSVLASLPRLA